MQPLDGYHFYTLASATSFSTLPDSQVLPASAVTFEIYSDNTVKAYYIEEPFTPIGCSNNAPCYASDFVAALKAKI
jgi:hypothetical protein